MHFYWTLNTRTSVHNGHTYKVRMLYLNLESQHHTPHVFFSQLMGMCNQANLSQYFKVYTNTEKYTQTHTSTHILILMYHTLLRSVGAAEAVSWKG